MATMKAIVRTGLEPEQMFLKDAPIPAVKENEALIRVKAVGICGTDAHIWSGEVKTEIPVIVGHEFSGVVEKLGAAATGLNVGDRVVSRLNIGVCGTCRNCLTGNPHMCERRACPGFKIDGAYAEYIAIDSKQLVKLADTVSFEEGAVVEPMAIVAHALLERAKVEPEDVVVVLRSRTYRAHCIANGPHSGRGKSLYGRRRRGRSQTPSFGEKARRGRRLQRAKTQRRGRNSQTDRRQRRGFGR